MAEEWRRGEFVVSTDASRLDLGVRPVASPDRWMEKADPDIYRRAAHGGPDSTA